MKTGQILREAAARAAGAGGGQSGAHPEPDILLAYARGETAGDAKEAVQEHLAICKSCAHAVLDFRKFPEITAPRGEELSDREIDAEWLKLLGREPRLAKTGTGDGPPAKPVQPWRLAYGLAACFLMLSVGLAAWNVSLRTQVADLSQPRVNVFVPLLTPASARAAENDIRIPAHVKFVRFELPFADDEGLAYDSYRIAITDSDGRETFSNTEIEPGRSGDFSIELATWQLPDKGAIKVVGFRENTPVLLVNRTFLREKP